MDGNTMVQAEDLTRSYERKTALDKISFTIGKGDCAGLLGRNGAGKTTLLKIILGLLQQTSGVIRYEGRHQPGADFKKRTGFYIGKEYLPEELTGLQYLQFLNHLYNPGKLRAEAELLGLIDYFFEGTDSGSQLIGGYSFGMMQKIGVCGALVNQPDFLVLDEPFSGLDAFSCQRLIGFLQQYRQGRTILLSSHDLSFVEKICNRLLVLEEGKVLYDNTMEDFTLNGRHSLEESLFKLLRPQETDGEKINWLI